jgi:antitoxin HicB
MSKRDKPIKNPHRGSRVDDWLKEEGIYEAATQKAIKEVIAWQLAKVMETEGITKVEMARRMKTSRWQLDRVLDPTQDGVSLETLNRAAAAVGRKVRLELV